MSLILGQMRPSKENETEHRQSARLLSSFLIKELQHLVRQINVKNVSRSVIDIISYNVQSELFNSVLKQFF